MGLFSRSKKKTEEKKIPDPVYIKVADRIVYEQLKDDSDEYLTNLAKELINGNPLVLDYSLLDIDPANKALSFFSGVVFAIEGDIRSIRDKIFIFTAKDSYNDGSLEEHLKQI